MEQWEGSVEIDKGRADKKWCKHLGTISRFFLFFFLSKVSGLFSKESLPFLACSHQFRVDKLQFLFAHFRVKHELTRVRL